MEKLICVCPKTTQQVDIGVATEIGTLLRIRSRSVRAQCPACGETHEWLGRGAQLVQGACTPPYIVSASAAILTPPRDTGRGTRFRHARSCCGSSTSEDCDHVVAHQRSH